MAIMSKIPLYAIEDMLNIYGESLWTNILLPDEIIKQTLIDNIMMQAEDRPVLYTDPDFLRKRIEIWFTKNYDNFEAMIESLLKDYDIFDNYHREKEEWKKENHVKDGTVVSTGSTTGTTTGSYSNSGSDSDTTTKTVAAFDTNSYEPYDKAVSSGTNSESGQSTQGINRSETGRVENDETNTADDYLKSKVKGKLGVATYQELIQQELELRKFNIYDYITNQFLREFIILVSM